MTEEQRNEATFREILRLASECRDPAAAVELVTDDVVVVDYTDPTVTHHGRAAVAGAIEAVIDLFSELRIEVVDLVANGDRLAAEILARGVPKGQSEPVEMHYLLYDVFRDGKIASEHLYVDSAQVPAGL